MGGIASYSRYHWGGDARTTKEGGDNKMYEELNAALEEVRDLRQWLSARTAEADDVIAYIEQVSTASATSPSESLST